MSRHHIEKVTCPSCHHEGDFELWDSINTALDPEMKEKVLNKSIFLYHDKIFHLWRDLSFKLSYTLSPDGRSYHDLSGF